MDKVQKLQADRAAALKKMADLVKAAEDANRDLNEGEQTAYDAAKADAESLAKRIERALEVERNQAALATPVAGANGVVAAGKALSIPARAKTGRVRYFKGASAHDDAFKAGMFVAAVIAKNERAIEWCRENGIALTKAQGEGTNSAGGYLVLPEFERTVIDLREEYGAFRSWAGRVPMASDNIVIPKRLTGLTAYPTAEGVAITESAKTWGSVELTAKKWGVLTRWSKELNEDAIISMADDLANEIAYAFAVAEDNAGFNGDGTSTYNGITGLRTKIIDGTHTKSAVDGATGHDTFAEIDASDLANVMAALPQYALRGAEWYCSQPAFSLVFERLAQGVGGLTKSDFAGRTMPSYQGYPIVISQSLPTDTGDLSNVAMLFFGDLSLAVAFGDRRGVTVDVSQERYFAEDQIAIKGTERFDINAHSLGDTSVAGPIVALIGE